MTLQAQEIKRLKNEVEKLKADLRGKDNEINDLKALVDYLKEYVQITVYHILGGGSKDETTKSSF